MGVVLVLWQDRGLEAEPESDDEGAGSISSGTLLLGEDRPDPPQPGPLAWSTMVTFAFEPFQTWLGKQKRDIVLETCCSGTGCPSFVMKAR